MRIERILIADAVERRVRGVEVDAPLRLVENHICVQIRRQRALHEQRRVIGDGGLQPELARHCAARAGIEQHERAHDATVLDRHIVALAVDAVDPILIELPGSVGIRRGTDEHLLDRSGGKVGPGDRGSGERVVLEQARLRHGARVDALRRRRRVR